MDGFKLIKRVEITTASPNVDLHFGPYADIEEANRLIIPSLRAQGKVVGIFVNGEVVDYSWKLGIGDADLVVKSVPVSACLTAACVQSMEVFENDFEASALPDYTPYRTSTGELRYKLPFGSRPLYWIDTNLSIDSEMWID